MRPYILVYSLFTFMKICLLVAVSAKGGEPAAAHHLLAFPYEWFVKLWRNECLRMYLVNHLHPNDAAMAPASLVEAMLEHGDAMPFRKGSLILSAESIGQEVYLVRRGSVQVAVLSPNGRETILRDIGAGQCFGELAAIDGGPRSANVTALADGSLVWVRRERFLRILAEHADVSLWFLAQYSRQIRELTERIYELSSHNVASRLQNELLRMAHVSGVESGEFLIRRAPTHAELAARIGTNRESVTRELRHLADERLITQKGRYLTIHSVQALRARVATKGR